MSLLLIDIGILDGIFTYKCEYTCVCVCVWEYKEYKEKIYIQYKSD